MAAFDHKKRDLLKATGAGLVLATSATLSDTAEAKGRKRKAVQRTSSLIDRQIATGWTFRQADTTEWLPATVPGTVHTDLLANKKIEDPFYRTNEHDQQWIDKKDWEYATTFTVDAATFARNHVELWFEGLDTYADVYVNDTKVLTADNMFREWTADIKPHIKTGANALRIYFRSPIMEGKKKLDAYGFNLPAANDQSENGEVGKDKYSVFTRKAGYHYGWDWGPRFVTSGVWRPIHLRAWNTARIDNVQIVQESLSPDRASLTAVFEIIADHDGSAMLDISSPTDARIHVTSPIALRAGVNRIELPITVVNPKLWWTNGLGEAFLYTLNSRLSTPAAVLDTHQVRVGLRTVKIVQTPDAGGSSFYVELNGVPVFMKGANYIPNDNFLTRVTHDIYDKVIRSAVDTHMTMLRVWGGGVYEDNYFYDQCDRNGILVWHDFMFACSMYPGDKAFLDSVRQETIDNVKRLRNHPSIALWIGNNEIDSAWANDVPNGGWGWKPQYDDAQKAKIWDAYKAIFHNILPSVVKQYDSGRFYWPSSPLAAWDGKDGLKHADVSAAIQTGDTHYWEVWGGRKPFSEYRTHVSRFVSEYGFQSFPEFRTVQTYAAPEDYDIFSKVMLSHQRANDGNTIIKTYMERDYKVPADFRQFLYVGQVLQAEGIKIAMEAHRSRMPYCMGSMFWQINDCWPVASWSSIDYYGRWKAQQYFAVKAYDTVLVSPQLDNGKVSLYVVSDLLKDKQATLSLRLLDFSGKVLSQSSQPIVLKANTASLVQTQTADALLAGAAAETSVLSVRLLDGGKVLSENTVYFKPVKDLALPKPAIVKSVKQVGGDIVVAVTSNALVKNLYLSLEAGDGRFSDNYFDILPGETAVVHFRPAGSMTVAAFEKNLKLMHMADVQTV